MEARVTQPGLGKTIDIGGRDLRAVATEVSESDVIKQNEQHVGAASWRRW
jgi:hypothetical protein